FPHRFWCIGQEAVRERGPLSLRLPLAGMRASGRGRCLPLQIGSCFSDLSFQADFTRLWTTEGKRAAMRGVYFLHNLSLLTWCNLDFNQIYQGHEVTFEGSGDSYTKHINKLTGLK
ncbi:unnamed protein product, partial [Rangifer tarandus platyrhynchus]